MKNKICKYCGSGMNLTESEPDYEFWTCMNKDCNAMLTLDDNYDWEQWEHREH